MGHHCGKILEKERQLKKSETLLPRRWNRHTIHILFNNYNENLGSIDRQVQADFERSGEESRLGPENQHSDEFPGLLFGLKSLNPGDKRSQQHRNIDRYRGFKKKRKALQNSWCL